MRRVKENNVCFADQCTSASGDPGVYFFKFPKKEALRERWTHLTSRSYSRVPSKSDVLCHKHFPPKMLLQTFKLKPHASPILPAPKPDLKTKENVESSPCNADISMQIPTTSQNKIRCHAVNCTSTVGDVGVTFFEVPEEKYEYEAWCVHVGNDPNTECNRPEICVVCHKHFPLNMLEPTLQLKPNAAPVLCIPKPAPATVPTAAAVPTATPVPTSTDTAANQLPKTFVGSIFQDKYVTSDEIQRRKEIIHGNYERQKKIAKSCNKVDKITQESDDIKQRYETFKNKIDRVENKFCGRKYIRKNKFINVKTYSKQKNLAATDVGEQVVKDECNDPQVCYFDTQLESEEYENMSKTPNAIDETCVPIQMEETFAVDEDRYKSFIINFRLSNPSGYKFLRRSLNLPSDKKLRKMFEYLRPLDSKALQLLDITKNHLPKNANLCTLCIEQVTLSKRLFYDIKRDEIIGFEEVFNEKANIGAEVALVAMLRGISVPWTLPVSYCFLSSLNNHAAIDDYIKVMVMKLLTVGYLIQALVLPPTKEMFTYASTRNLTSSNSSVFHGIRCIFDVRGLIKNVREIMFVGNITAFDKQIPLCSYMHTIAFNEKQHKSELLLIPKIKKKHLIPYISEESNFDIVSETFSMEMVNAFKSYIKFNIFKVNNETSALASAEFMEIIYKLINFFVTNERNATLHSDEDVFTPSERNLLEKSYDMFCSIKSDTDYDTEIGTIANLTFQMFAMTINSFKEVFNILKSYDIKSIKTQTFNLEPIQDMLDAFRKKRSCAALKFYLDLHWNIKIFGMPKKGKKRCDLRSVMEEVQSLPALSETAGVAGNPAVLQGDVDYQFNIPDKEALVYIAAFLMFKCTMCHSFCVTFAEFSTSVDLYEKYPNFKELNESKTFYNCLQVPPDEFLCYLYNLENEFCIRYEEAMRTSVAATLLEYLSQVPYIPPCACFPVQYVLKLFVRLRIYQALHVNNYNMANNLQINEGIYLM